MEELANCRPPDLRAGDFHTQLAAARAGLGVALLPSIMGDISPDIERAAVEYHEARPVWMVIHTLRRAPPVRAVTDVLVHAFTKLCRFQADQPGP